MKHLLLTLLISIPFLTFAQDNEIKWERDITFEAGGKAYHVAKIGKQIFAIKFKTKSTIGGFKAFPVVEEYTEDGRLDSRTDLLLANKGRQFENMIVFGRDLYVLSSDWDGEKKKRTIYMQMLSKEYKSLQGKEKKIGNATNLEKGDPVIIKYAVSPDLKTIAFSVSPTNPKSTRSTTARAYVMSFDERGRLKRRYSKRLRMKIRFPSVELEDIVVNDAGDVYVLMTSFGTQEIDPEELDNEKMIVVGFTHDGDSIKKHTPPMDGKGLIHGFLALNGLRGAGGFTAAAIYREGDMETAEGAIAFAYGRLGNLKNTSVMEMNYPMPEAVTEAETKKEKDWFIMSKRVTSMDWKMQYLIAEYHVPSDDAFNYYDMMVLGLNEAGDLKWTTNVVKRQETSGDDGRYCGFLPVSIKGRLVLLFNDVEDNFSAKENDELSAFEGDEAADAAGNAAVKVVINREGVYAKKHEMISGAEEGTFMPSLSFTNGRGEVVFYIRNADFDNYRAGTYNFNKDYVD